MAGFEISVVIVNAASVKAFERAIEIVVDMADAQPYCSDLQEARALLLEAAEGLELESDRET